MANETIEQAAAIMRELRQINQEALDDAVDRPETVMPGVVEHRHREMIEKIDAWLEAADLSEDQSVDRLGV